MAGQIGELGVNARKLVELDTNTARDTVTILVQDMEERSVPDQTQEHDPVLSDHVQVKFIQLIIASLGGRRYFSITVSSVLYSEEPPLGKLYEFL